MTNAARENYDLGNTESLRQWMPQIFPIIQFANANGGTAGRDVCDSVMSSAISVNVHDRAADVHLDGLIIDQIKIGDGLFKFLCTWHRQFNVESVTWNGLTWSDTDCGITKQNGLDLNVDHLYINFRSAASEVQRFILSLLLYGLSGQVNGTYSL